MQHSADPSVSKLTPTAAWRRIAPWLWAWLFAGLLAGPLAWTPAAASGTAAPAAAAAAAQTSPFTLTALERSRILSLGPWPVAPRNDPSNRVSGQPMAVELGRRLFSDPRMSPVGYVACVSCHQPDRGFTDLKPRAHGLADLPRHTPGLENLGQRRWYGWGGGSDSLWMASIRPILDAREFGGSAASVQQLFERDPELAACYVRVFGAAALAQPEAIVLNVGKALAAFVETLVTARTAFDDFRDAVARGDSSSSYAAAALRGLKRFVGDAGCLQCHAGPYFSDQRFHRLDLPADSPARALHLPPDSGRRGDAQRLHASPYNLLGIGNDDLSGRQAAKTRRLAVTADLQGRFRTPPLRNVAFTAPYFHAGQIERLQDAVMHRSPSGPGQPKLPTVDAVADLVAFLESLGDGAGLRRPWPPQASTHCP